MPNDIDPSALSKFQNLNFGSENAIAQISEDGSELKSDTKYHVFGSASGRDEARAEENNRTRTELLKSLGQAFGLSGISEKNGKVTFSRDFMDNLETLLGKDVLKRDSFGVSGDEGTVTSGKPLTQRRIAAIIGKASLYTSDDPEQGFYRNKLEVIRNELNAAAAAESLEVMDRAMEELKAVLACVKLLTLGLITPVPDKTVEQADEEIKKAAEQEKKKLAALSAGRAGLEGVGPRQTTLLEALRAKTGLTLSSLESPSLQDPGKKEIEHHIRLALLNYVRISCNAYSAALRNGCLDRLVECLRASGQDIDMRTRKLIEFEAELRSR